MPIDAVALLGRAVQNGVAEASLPKGLEAFADAMFCRPEYHSLASMHDAIRYLKEVEYQLRMGAPVFEEPATQVHKLGDPASFDSADDVVKTLKSRRARIREILDRNS